MKQQVVCVSKSIVLLSKSLRTVDADPDGILKHYLFGLVCYIFPFLTYSNHLEAVFWFCEIFFNALWNFLNIWLISIEIFSSPTLRKVQIIINLSLPKIDLIKFTSFTPFVFLLISSSFPPLEHSKIYICWKFVKFSVQNSRTFAKLVLAFFAFLREN